MFRQGNPGRRYVSEGVREINRFLALGAVVLLIAVSTAALASPIPGSNNEVVNGAFETGTFSPWIAGAGMVVEADGAGHGYAARAVPPNSPTDTLRQAPIDESLNPLWEPSFHAKLIDLQSDIRVAWTPGDVGHPRSDIKFRLDWWNESRNGTSPSQLPGVPDGVSNYVTFTFTTADQNGVWKTVNPFNQTFLRDGTGAQIQPRWVSVEINIDQAPGETVWVDNVILTGKCVGGVVPEPSSFLALGSGFLALCGALRRKLYPHS